MAAVKGAQNATTETPTDRDPISVREITIKMPITMARSPEGKMVTEIMQAETIKIRLEGEMIKTKSNAITARFGGICNTSAPVPEIQGHLNSRRGTNSRTSPWYIWTECGTCTTAQCHPTTNKSCYQSLISLPGCCSRINWGGSMKDDIFVGDIWVTGSHWHWSTSFPPLLETFVKNMGMKYTLSKTNAVFRGNRKVHHCIPGVQRSYC